MDPFNSQAHADAIRQAIEHKPALRRFYEQAYSCYADCLGRCPKVGDILELGAGAGFAKEYIPDLITSDIIAYRGIDCVVDGMHLPFADRSLRLICMMNVFHHIQDVSAFLAEVDRCLVPKGRLLIVDQHRGHISRPILKYLHQEPFDDGTDAWHFPAAGPLLGANGALAWMVFIRDAEKFKRKWPRLTLVGYQPHSPLWYWLSGGLKRWNLLPHWMWRSIDRAERALLYLSVNFGSFVNIELTREEGDRTENSGSAVVGDD